MVSLKLFTAGRNFFKCLILLTAVSVIYLIATLRKETYYFGPERIQPCENSEAESEGESDVENIPWVFLDKESVPKRKSNSCAKFPELVSLKFNNKYWQVLHTSDRIYYFYNAYLDARKSLKKTVVRVLGLMNGYFETVNLFCQFWYDKDKEPKITSVIAKNHIWYKQWGGAHPGIINPYLLTCSLPENDERIPISVSLAEKKCDQSTVNLKILHHFEDTKKEFAVCVKGMNFDEDYSIRLIEWIELINLLGASKIYFYNFHIPTSMKKVLKHYIKNGMIEVTEITLAGEAPNIHKLQDLFLKKKTLERRLQEVIPYNDCLYKNYNSYKYLLALDLDEVIVPAEGNWSTLISYLEENYPGKASYVAQNVYFLDSYEHDHVWFEDIPKYMHMLQHVFRAKKYSKPGQFVKCFHDSEKIITLHNHFPINCVKSCNRITINASLAHMQHYRSTCVKEVNCTEYKDSVMDTRLWQYKEELIKRVKNTMSYLGFDMR